MSTVKRIVSLPPSYGTQLILDFLYNLCFLRMVVEDSSDSGHAVDLYSKALRSVIDEETQINSLDRLQKVKYVGPKISKVLDLSHQIFKVLCQGCSGHFMEKIPTKWL